MEKQKGDIKLDAKEDNTIKELTKGLPIIQQASCNFQGYDIDTLMKETLHLRKMITKRGTLEILIPLCCNTIPVRYQAFRKSMKGFSSKTLAIRLKELEKNGILSRKSYNKIPPRVEYTLTDKGQELTESIISLLHWMKKWSSG
ncbi:MAG: winged helix-turn-helix transcriptional regulator [Candidatus Nitrosocosmicus sp.]